MTDPFFQFFFCFSGNFFGCKDVILLNNKTSLIGSLFSLPAPGSEILEPGAPLLGIPPEGMDDSNPEYKMLALPDEKSNIYLLI